MTILLLRCIALAVLVLASTDSGNSSPSLTSDRYLTSSIPTSNIQSSSGILASSLDVSESLSDPFTSQSVSSLEECKDDTCNTTSSQTAFAGQSSDNPISSLSESLGIRTNQSLVLDGFEVNSTIDEKDHKILLNFSNMTDIDLADEEVGRNTSEDCTFMSFEEWKKQKNIESQKNIDFKESEEKEADIPKVENSLMIQNDTNIEKEDQGRTYKDKFNYASSDCAATVVSTNSDAKGASSILKEVKDSYLLNKCSTPNKFVVIELCQDILVSSVVMGNFELFSSMFKSVKLLVSDRFPVTEWKELGVFEAENIRDVQSFDIENPLIWARYLRIDILSHYGNEFYCPISLVRVHGTTMMEEFKDDSGMKQDPIPNDKLLNYNEEEEDECRLVLPYLALNEFLKDINTTDEYCHVQSEGTTSTETAVQKTQESILKNIVKRLSLLESNASLLLLYVEEQSKLLSDAFTRLEKRHSTKFESLVRNLNQTVSAQAAFLETTLNNVKAESRLLLDNHDAWMSGIVTNAEEKHHLLTRELSFQRKVIVIDTLLILALLAYVIVTRELFIAEVAESPTQNNPIKLFPVRSSKKIRHRKRKGKI